MSWVARAWRHVPSRGPQRARPAQATWAPLLSLSSRRPQGSRGRSRPHRGHLDVVCRLKTAALTVRNAGLCSASERLLLGPQASAPSPLTARTFSPRSPDAAFFPAVTMSRVSRGPRVTPFLQVSAGGRLGPAPRPHFLAVPGRRAALKRRYPRNRETRSAGSFRSFLNAPLPDRARPNFVTLCFNWTL